MKNVLTSKKYTPRIAFSLFFIAFLIVSLIPSKASALTVSPPRIEIAGDAGKTVTSEIELYNEQTTDNTFYFSTANFESQGEGGTPNFVTATDGLATWIRTPDSIELKAGEQKKIPFSIAIPEGVQPGGYFAGIFLSTTPNTATNGGQVSIGARVGILILLRVNGDITEKGGIVSFGVVDDQKFFTSLPVAFTYRFQNSGGDRVMPNGFIVIKNILGITSSKVSANKAQGNVLPFGSIRKFDAMWGEEIKNDDTGFFANVGNQWKNFAFGRYSAKLQLEYGVKGEQAIATTSFWVIPWHLSIVVLGGFFIIVFLGRFILRKYNHWAILQAEELLEHEQGLTHRDEPIRTKTVAREEVEVVEEKVKPKKVAKKRAPRKTSKSPRVMND